jgi:hypothetical protein
MDVVYLPPPDYPSRYGGPTVRRTQSTSAEATRILDWNYDVATSGPTSYRASRVTTTRHPTGRYYHDDGPEEYTVYRSRGSGASPSNYVPRVSPRQNSSGLSTSTVVSGLLGIAAGAAAGAALTYTMIKNDRDRAPRHEYDPPPVFSRRATFPERMPDRSSRRYVDIERSVERLEYPSDYPSVIDRHPRPEYLARYSHGSERRTREADDIYDDDYRSRSSYRGQSVGGSTRTRSEASTARTPFMLADTDYQSRPRGSKYGNTPPITRSGVRRSHTYDVGDRESFVTARSHKSGSTIRPAANLASAHLLRSHSRADSLASSSRSMGREGSYLSARSSPLRHSGLDDWVDDDDSIAPSDSISCVGSRPSRKAYY